MPSKLTQEIFLYRANSKHDNYYDYSLAEYINANTKIKIICPKHGMFKQQPNNHLYGQGCIKCMGDRVRKSRKFTKEQWVERFKEVHGDRYDYSQIKIGEGSGTQYKIIITCPTHGEFIQRPQAHSKGEGCPSCNSSKGELEVEKYLIKNDIKYKREKKFKECINPKTNKILPFDFYLPNTNLVIEYHGEQHYKKSGWFEKRNGGFKGIQYRDNIKKQFCSTNNISYIEIPYIEFNNINQILKLKKIKK